MIPIYSEIVKNDKWNEVTKFTHRHTKIKEMVINLNIVNDNDNIMYHCWESGTYRRSHWTSGWSRKYNDRTEHSKFRTMKGTWGKAVNQSLRAGFRLFPCRAWVAERQRLWEKKNKQPMINNQIQNGFTYPAYRTVQSLNHWTSPLRYPWHSSFI